MLLPCLQCKIPCIFNKDGDYKCMVASYQVYGLYLLGLRPWSQVVFDHKFWLPCITNTLLLFIHTSMYICP